MPFVTEVWEGPTSGTFTVPDDIAPIGGSSTPRMLVQLYGASGGDSAGVGPNKCYGGAGAVVIAVMEAIPGHVWEVVAGGRGLDGVPGAGFKPGGFPNGGPAQGRGGSGGGMSMVRSPAYPPNGGFGRIAGGGGGAGSRDVITAPSSEWGHGGVGATAAYSASNPLNPAAGGPSFGVPRALPGNHSTIAGVGGTGSYTLGTQDNGTNWANGGVGGQGLNGFVPGVGGDVDAGGGGGGGWAGGGGGWCPNDGVALPGSGGAGGLSGTVNPSTGFGVGGFSGDGFLLGGNIGNGRVVITYYVAGTSGGSRMTRKRHPIGGAGVPLKAFTAWRLDPLSGPGPFATYLGGFMSFPGITILKEGVPSGFYPWQVPAGVETLTIRAAGSSGSSDQPSGLPSSTGGMGMYAEVTMPSVTDVLGAHNRWLWAGWLTAIPSQPFLSSGGHGAAVVYNPDGATPNPYTNTPLDQNTDADEYLVSGGGGGAGTRAHTSSTTYDVGYGGPGGNAYPAASPGHNGVSTLRAPGAGGAAAAGATPGAGGAFGGADGTGRIGGVGGDWGGGYGGHGYGGGGGGGGGFGPSSDDHGSGGGGGAGSSFSAETPTVSGASRTRVLIITYDAEAMEGY